MCGIFGLVTNQESQFERAQLRALLDGLFRLSESRGKDASGLATVGPDAITVLKRPVRARKLIRSAPYRALVNAAAHRETGTLAVIGHARMVTNGSEETHANNQPVAGRGMVCLHNGIVVNDAALWTQFPELERQHEVDTEIIIALVRHYRGEGLPLVEAVIAAFGHLEGANSVALVPGDRDGVILATTNGSLFFARGHAGTELIFASEKYILERTIQHAAARDLFAGSPVVQVQPGEGYAVAFADLAPARFMLAPNPATGHDRARDLPSRDPARSIRDLKPARPYARTARPAPLTADEIRANDAFIADVNAAVAELRRCTRCLLPETFPFIEYDESGVCNYCHNYRPLQPQGADALEALVAPHRSANGAPDCLVPLSGGRDSSYGLHYIVTELGMTPVAYTYDWGMVTDLARRNISRMCGELGIEHILISADIRTKRANIRKNVLAWLRRPDLGTVPLFMAGDKQFFYYANLLKRQMVLPLTFFSQNDLERTDFKSGFCGVNENRPKSIYWNLSQTGKLRMALYYAGQFIRNPAFLNSSLLDTVFAFFSYYWIPRDFVLIYHYLRWDEALFTRTLRERYDWELAGDTATTWRIGDGTASFYNYIYYTMAGFTENDTLRSNQIREGMISRADALRRVIEENQPRYDSIQWYCNTVGVDFRHALRAINAAPKRYALD